MARFVGESEQAFGVGQQRFTGGRQHKTPPVADKEFRAELLFELLDACGDVRLHAVELRGGARHAVLAYDGPKNRQGGQVHDSLLAMNGIQIIHFS
jgi:hypothetical protein